MLVERENRGGTPRFWPGHMVVYFLIQEILAQERFADDGGFGELMNVVWNIMNFHCLQHIEWVAFCV